MESRRNGPQLSSRHDDDDDDVGYTAIAKYSVSLPIVSNRTT